MKIPVEGNPTLYRDSESGAIINCSDSEYNSYLRSKEMKLKERTEIDNIKNDVNEMKEMMRMILQKLETSK